VYSPRMTVGACVRVRLCGRSCVRALAWSGWVPGGTWGAPSSPVLVAAAAVDSGRNPGVGPGDALLLTFDQAVAPLPLPDTAAVLEVFAFAPPFPANAVALSGTWQGPAALRLSLGAGTAALVPWARWNVGALEVRTRPEGELSVVVGRWKGAIHRRFRLPRGAVAGGGARGPPVPCSRCPTTHTPCAPPPPSDPLGARMCGVHTVVALGIRLATACPPVPARVFRVHPACNPWPRAPGERQRRVQPVRQRGGGRGGQLGRRPHRRRRAPLQPGRAGHRDHAPHGGRLRCPRRCAAVGRRRRLWVASGGWRPTRGEVVPTCRCSTPPRKHPPTCIHARM
jgi:hypothetical protein